MPLQAPFHAGLALLLALAAVACAGKSVDLDGAGQGPAGGGGGGGATTPVTLVTSTDYEDCYDIAVDSERLYWLASEPGTPSLLRSCLKDNCDKTRLTYPTNVSNGVREASLMKVRGVTVYWLAWDLTPVTQLPSTANSSIWGCPVTGCSVPQLLVADAGEGGFEVDTDEIYFASPSGNGLLACPISGCAGTPRTLPSWDGHEPPGLYITNFPIAAGDSLYWVSKSGELVRLRKDGSSPPEMLAKGLGHVAPLAANESYVYWPVPLLAGSIGRCAYPACVGGLQPFAPNLRRPERLVIEGDALFFQHQLATGDWEIASCSLANCAEPRAIAPLITGGGFDSEVTPMAVDEAWVYLRSYTTPSSSQRLRIQRVRR